MWHTVYKIYEVSFGFNTQNIFFKENEIIDIDSMDPSIAPNVIGRSPGGLTYFQVLSLIKGVAKKANITAIDFVEIMPEVDVDGIGGLTVSRLVATTMGILARQNI